MGRTVMWKVSSYEKRGRSHEKAGLPCQDKTYYINNGDTYVIALADGAGSAKFSEAGAACVTRCICAYFADRFNEVYYNNDGIAVKKEILSVLRNALAKLADEMNCKVRDLSSTLLCCAINDGHYILVHIGDGVIAVEKDGRVKPASLPKNGEYLNQTTFVTSSEAPIVMNLYRGKLDDIEGFLLMSDGTAAALFDRRSLTLAPAAKSLFDWTRDFTQSTVGENLKKSFDLAISKKTTDDCSMILLKRSADSRTLPLPHLALSDNCS